MEKSAGITEYSGQLARISEAILEMTALVRKQLSVVKLLLDEKECNSIEQQVKDIDVQINALDREIEGIAQQMLHLRRPMGRDFRIVLSSIKICAYIEKMGDLMKKVAKKAVISSQTREMLSGGVIVDNLSNVDAKLNDMLQLLEDAFKEYSSDMATTVWQYDDEIDALYDNLYKRIQHEMQQKPDAISDYMHVMFIAKNFERIGDYISKLAEIVYYISSGKRFDKRQLRIK